MEKKYSEKKNLVEINQRRKYIINEMRRREIHSYCYRKHDGVDFALVRILKLYTHEVCCVIAG